MLIRSEVCLDRWFLHMGREKKWFCKLQGELWMTALSCPRDLLMRDNLFEIITSNRTFYIQVRG